MRIKIDYAKCTGCKLCQVACSLAHTGSVNPQRSRVRVFVGEESRIRGFPSNVISAGTHRIPSA